MPRSKSLPNNYRCKGIWTLSLLVICSVLFLTFPDVVDASIEILSPDGTRTTKSSLLEAASSPDAKGKTVVVTSPLSPVFSNISSQTIHAWPTDRILKIEKGGAVSNTTTFRIAGKFHAGLYKVFNGPGRVTFDSGSVSEIYPEWWGAQGDGVNDDSTAIRKSGESLTHGQSLVFTSPAYLISSSGGSWRDAYGKKILYLKNRNHIKLVGRNGATIRLQNHNISSAGGLMFIWVEGSHDVQVRGLSFDMTFTGTNNKGDSYPFCGAMIFMDPASGTRPASELNQEIRVSECSFRIYHPDGQYRRTDSPFQGDNNNGFKILSIFFFGDYKAVDKKHMNSDCYIADCIFKDGHNAYGIWVWAFDEVVIKNNLAESYVAKWTDSSGRFGGSGVPFIRYIRFHQSNVLIEGNVCNFKPSAKRIDGFEGAGDMIYVVTNFAKGDLTNGNALILRNRCNGLSSDGANKVSDGFILANTFGRVVIDSNIIQGESQNAAIGYAMVIGQRDENGRASYTVSNNQIDRNFGGVVCRILSGNSVSASSRRIKSFKFLLNRVEGCFHAIIVDQSRHSGVERLELAGNVVSGLPDVGKGYFLQLPAEVEHGDAFAIDNNIIGNFRNLYRGQAKNGTLYFWNNYVKNITETGGTVDSQRDETFPASLHENTFAAGATVNVMPAGKAYVYRYVETSSDGVQVDYITGYSNGVTPLAMVRSKNSGVLSWSFVE